MQHLLNMVGSLQVLKFSIFNFVEKEIVIKKDFGPAILKRFPNIQFIDAFFKIFDMNFWKLIEVIIIYK